jgi:hypothetical protein
MSRYGSEVPPQIPLDQLKIPVALVSGSSDLLANPEDVAWLHEKIAPHVVFAQEYNLGHMSFTLAKDMTWFKEDVMNVIG